jgi:hypothetical protein
MLAKDQQPVCVPQLTGNELLILSVPAHYILMKENGLLYLRGREHHHLCPINQPPDDSTAVHFFPCAFLFSGTSFSRDECVLAAAFREDKWYGSL